MSEFLSAVQVQPEEKKKKFTIFNYLVDKHHQVMQTGN